MCERLTFASIYQSNLDEFYMVRVGSLVDQMFLSKDIRENKTNMTPKEQLEAVLSRTRKLNQKRDVIYEEIMDSLKEYGVQMLNFHKIEKEDRNYLERYFEAEVAPVISPSIVGKKTTISISQNIHIISIVGRFLEHSRIYIFGTQERAKIYIASADFMTRNTLRRVEVAAPIEDPDIRMQIQEMFVTMLSDNRKARKMNSKGNYKIEESDNAPLNSQEVFLQQAYANTAAEGKEQ